MERSAKLLAVLVTVVGFASVAMAAKVVVNPDNVMEIDGKKVLFISFSPGPPPNAKTPWGKDGYQELADAGATFLRTGVLGEKLSWSDEGIEKERVTQAAAAKARLYCMMSLKELSSLDEKQPKREEMLKKVLGAFKDSRSLAAYKGVDEPEWGKHPIPPMLRAYKLIKQIDPDRIVWVAQAPRGTLATLRPYEPTYDATGMDVYPVAYPPGGHSLEKNKNLSMVGDFTKLEMAVTQGKKPVWMVLQIAWSGVAKEGKTLRYPTFEEQRYMTYQALVCGARGVQYFGGGLPMTLTERDKPLGWNWTFWERVLRPVIAEIGTKSPLYPALVAPDSKLKVTVKPAKEGNRLASNELEYCVREVGNEVFVIATKREGQTLEVEFDGLPASAGEGSVMYEEPRKVKAAGGKFTDWFAPYDVHVYRFKRSGS